MKFKIYHNIAMLKAFKNLLIKFGTAIAIPIGQFKWRDEMTMRTLALLMGLGLVAVFGGPAWATPSATFWTPCTTYLQPAGVPHITYDSYFNRAADYPTDVGLTIGLLPGEKVQAEAGFDLFLPGEFPWQFNFKAGVPEDALFKYSPGINAGIFGMGFVPDVNNYNVIHATVGHAIPKVGSLAAGFYQGTTRDLLESSDGEDQSRGYMAAYYRTLEPWTERLAITADYMSGKNLYGGGGVGLYLWPSRSVDVILGWVWFNDGELNPYPNGLFTIQLDVDLDFQRHLEKAGSP